MATVKVWSERGIVEVEVPTEAAVWVVNDWLARHGSKERVEAGDVIAGET
ncbi:hypothetical protein AB0I81_34755 [Nonomuraea sp. NPDC050404]